MRDEPLRVTLIAAFILSLLLVAVAASAGDRAKSLTITADEIGDELSITVSKALAMGVLENVLGSTLSCDGTVDSEFKDLLRTLDQGGRGMRASMRDGDSVIHAKRRGGTVKMDIRDLDDGGMIEVVMPWAVAECLLGRDVTVDKSARKIKIKVTDADGGSFAFKVK